MEQRLSDKLKKFNRELLKQRIQLIRQYPQLDEEGITEKKMFNLKTALESCDSFDDLYEIVKVL